MQCWKWSSREQASLITNHMHVADFNYYSAGKLLTRTKRKRECELHGQGVRWLLQIIIALITCATITTSEQAVDSKPPRMGEASFLPMQACT